MGPTASGGQVAACSLLPIATDDLHEQQPSGRESGILLSVVVVAGSMLVASALTFVALAFTGHRALPDEYAGVTAANSFLLWVTVPTVGIQGAAAVGLARGASRAGLLGKSVLLGLVTAVLTAAVALLWHRQLGFSTPATLLWVAAMLAPQFVLTVQRGVLQGGGRYVVLAASLLLEGVARCLLVLFTAHDTAAGVMRAFAISAVLSAAFTWLSVALAHRSDPHAATGEPIRLWSLLTSLPTLFALGYTAMTNIDAIVANARLNGEPAGEYGVLVLVGKIVLFVPVAVTLVILPEAARRAHQHQSMAPVRWLGTGLCMAGMLPVTIAGFVVPGLIRTVIVGDQYYPADRILGFYTLGMLAYGVFSILGQVEVARDRRSGVLLAAAAAVAMVVATLVIPASPAGLVAVVCVVAGVIAVIQLGLLVISPREVSDRAQRL